MREKDSDRRVLLGGGNEILKALLMFFFLQTACSLFREILLNLSRINEGQSSCPARRVTDSVGQTITGLTFSPCVGQTTTGGCALPCLSCESVPSNVRV